MNQEEGTFPFDLIVFNVLIVIESEEDNNDERSVFNILEWLRLFK